ncbi:MAG: polysaccharide pyruvyl transferase family protein [Phenylobacterium sp.]|uniref:polysaccharide pyruvyl transferase family protein n=1 Tax=Phenylobacterium sp. TaxID=1871053 RepID=UPI0027259EC5|nr:polysaccharide pyruvyl transferase family protein [Phenylobacterium sp.]MDO9429852.1 polysaccharide pyruvyl transferase family protein [Phenylobacterium sp.]
MAKAIRIGLLWHSASSGNLGVGALTLANLAIARDTAREMGLEPEFQIMGMRELNAPYLDEVEAARYPIDTKTLLSPRGFWSAVGQRDCVLDIGAGDSFADIYGPKRFGFLWLTKVMALARGKPLLLSPQTIGPFTKWPYRLLARFAMNRATAVVARDEMSLSALRGVAPKANGTVSVDVAFALPFQDRSAERGGARLRVGVNVSGLLFNEAESGRNRFGLDVDYAKLMRSFIRELAERPDIEVHLVTHALHATDPWDDDGRVADKLGAENPAAIRVPNFAGPSEAKSYISSLDFLVAGRMHACIAAFSSGTPVVPIAYSRKFTGLFGMLGYRWLVPVTGSDDASAHAFMMDCLARRSELERDVGEGMGKVGTLLDVYRSELRKFYTFVGGEK